MENVVLLHCSGSSGAQWRALAAQFAGRYRVTAPDLGSAPRLADAAAAVRLEGPVHLVGHSYGGGVALHIARRRPELLASLTLIEPSAFHLLPEGDALAEITAVAADVRAALATGDYDRGYGRFIDYWTGAGSWARMPLEKRAALAPQLPKIALEFQALLNEPAGIEDFCELAVPTLLVQGDRTKLPSRTICELLRIALPDARFRVIGGAGHMSPISHREPVNALVAAHLEALESTTEEQNHAIHAS